MRRTALHSTGSDILAHLRGQTRQLILRTGETILPTPFVRQFVEASVQQLRYRSNRLRESDFETVFPRPAPVNRRRAGCLLQEPLAQIDAIAFVHVQDGKGGSPEGGSAYE